MDEDPKSLWKEIPPPSDAPYQTPDTDSTILSDITGHTLAIVSRRGREHAHRGTFRDDSFACKWLAETGWLIVAVSDGAGSAPFSRAGSRIACETFVARLTEKLASREANAKIDALTDKDTQGAALKRLLLDTLNKSSLTIQDEAKAKEVQTKDYAATFLGYIAKRFGDEWLFCSVGIGDGAIGIIDKDGGLHLMNEPDGGEYVGQTRFITMPEVWQNPDRHAHCIRMNGFRFVMSMTDGVSDPKFETDNNLRDAAKWTTLGDEILPMLQTATPPEERLHQLLNWLAFYSPGYHDDRTLSVLFEEPQHA